MNEPMTIHNTTPQANKHQHTQPTQYNNNKHTKTHTHPQILNIYHSPYITPQQKQRKTRKTRKKEKV